MSVWFARALFFCTFSVEACESVTCEVPDFEEATRMIGSRVALPDKIDFISMCHPWCRTRIHLQHLACTWAFQLCLPTPQPHLHLRLRCRSTVSTRWSISRPGNQLQPWVTWRTPSQPPRVVTIFLDNQQLASARSPHGRVQVHSPSQGN